MATTSLKRVPTSLVIREMPTQTKVNDTNLQMAKELNRNLSKEDTQKKRQREEQIIKCDIKEMQSKTKTHHSLHTHHNGTKSQHQSTKC